MTTIAQRCELMSEEGIEQVFVLPFNETVAHWTPEEFVRTVLVEKLQTRAVLVGGDFRFGHKQAGDVRLLTELGAKYGFSVEVIEPVAIRGERVSSSLVRQMVQSGRVARACRFLTTPYALEGEVVHGQGVGSRQTVPTLNLAPTSDVLPANGIYVTRTTDLDDGRKWQSITNVGFRPTFGGQTLTIETFLLGPLGDKTPKRIRVEFLHRIRDERKFDSAEALKAQILRDVRRAEGYFRRVGQA
jgi:riboflavin kinase/FMN adenylyltransferase